ncbi:hypothetical protein ACRC7T_04615 [Segnochrobactraceae bacterium EtOH-i3]
MSSHNQNGGGWQQSAPGYGPGPGAAPGGYQPQGGWQQAGPGPGWQSGYQQAPGYGPGAGYQQAGPGYGPGPGAAPGGPAGRIDALDVLEGVLKDGFSLSNFTRIARASGSNLWIGAAIGAGLVVMMNRPDVRAAVSGIFSAAKTPDPKG